MSEQRTSNVSSDSLIPPTFTAIFSSLSLRRLSLSLPHPRLGCCGREAALPLQYVQKVPLTTEKRSPSSVRAIYRLRIHVNDLVSYGRRRHSLILSQHRAERRTWNKAEGQMWERLVASCYQAHHRFHSVYSRRMATHTHTYWLALSLTLTHTFDIHSP